MSTTSNKTLRLLFPQWQGGNNPPYFLGAQLLAWLAPEADGPVESVDVAEPDGQSLVVENGIVGRQALLNQQLNAQALIDRHSPDRIVVLGGDCLVDLVPFAYLNQRYHGDLAVLWVDAHPDVMTPQDFKHAHAMVLGNLLGHGDEDFTRFVSTPIKPERLLYAGLQETLPVESEFIKRHGLKGFGAQELAQSSKPVLDWLASINARHLAIHFDLDVLDPNEFRALLFANPNAPAGTFDGIAQGKMRIAEVLRLLTDVADAVDVVGLGIAEHLPWDALSMKNMLAQLPLLGNKR
ncbi:arginase family protein [Pseudomonas sp. NPDC089734]|uniref:arginase family protein n=1 Tax=Pseudomonas sp. NPDC089734 TaxID=3364469 RepID=UPI00382B720D